MTESLCSTPETQPYSNIELKIEFLSYTIKEKSQD